MIRIPTADDPVGIVHGDCLALLPTLPDGCVDAVITDPPYGLEFDYSSYDDTRDNLQRIIDAFVPQVRRIASRVYITPGQTQVSMYPAADWILCVTWDTTGTFGKYGYSQWMPVLAYGEDVAGFGNVNGIIKSDTLFVSGGDGVGFRRKRIVHNHPCPKPLNVVRGLIRRLSNRGDLILDPFLGSGTTAVAAVQEGRRCIGIEIDPGYCAIARRRVDEALCRQPGSLFAEVERKGLFDEPEKCL